MRALLPPALHLATPLSAPALALLRQLAQAALLGTIFVLAVWLLCRLAPRLPAGLRCALWWLACLKLLLGLAWPAPLVLALLPPAAPAAAGWPPPPAPPPTSTRPARVSARQGTSLSGGAAPSGTSRPSANLPMGAAKAMATAPFPAERPSALAPAAAGPPPSPSPDAAQFSGLVPAAPGPPPAAPWWVLGLACLWAAGAVRQIVRTARELRRVRGFLARSALVRDPALLRLAGDLGRALNLAPVELRAAPAAAGLAAPLTAGALRPVVVRPAAGLERLSRQELAMALAHELMHVRRRDLLWGWIPAAAARLFFFLPPAALAAREYARAREAPRDAAVLRLLGAAPASYGRLLLRLGVRGPIDPRQTRMSDLAPAATVGGAAASLQQLKRRLEMLQRHQPELQLQHRPARPRPLGFSLLALLALAALVPLHLVAAAPATSSQPATAPAVAIRPATAASTPAARPVAATPAATASPVVAAAHPTVATAAVATATRAAATTSVAAAMAGGRSDPDPADDTVEPAPVPEPPAPPDAPEVASAPPAPPPPPPPPSPHAAPAPAAPPAPPVPASPPSPPAPPAPPAPPDPPATYRSGSYSLHRWDDRRNGEPYVFLRGDSHVTMNGDTASIDRARKLQREAGGGDLLWMRHGGKEYVIRDAATLEEVREIFRPQEELGARQGKLGAEQGELGGKQGELGGRQGELGARQAKLGAEEGRLAAEQAKLAAEEAAGGDSGSAARERRRDELAKEQEKPAAQMGELGEQKRERGRQQRELGEPQRRLGDQQRELGRQQERAAREAERRLHALLDRAIAGGIAQEVR